jgi:hypothetical protein
MKAQLINESLLAWNFKTLTKARKNGCKGDYEIHSDIATFFTSQEACIKFTYTLIKTI